MRASMLLLADGRFPSGGHAHSAGAEAAIGAGDVADHATLRSFIEGRLTTAGLVDAAFTAATCHRCALDEPVPWNVLDAELRARTASPRLRAVGESLGRQLLRAGRRVWPGGAYDACAAALGADVLQPIAMGVVAHAAGCTAQEAALCELHHLVGAMTSAGVRLLGLDPFEAAATAAALAPTIEDLAARAAAWAPAEPAELPAAVSLLTDVLAEHHALWEVRLFAS